ncbi:MAG: transcriptional repressor [Actinomycetaceae bacterium]|nr:transcriptional repressor [Actinomycetaceae bacterium]
MARTATATRTLILDTLGNISRFISAQDLFAELKKSGKSIGLATIYRNLQALADEGLLDCLHTEGGTLYRLCTTCEHHHHLICNNCAETVELSEETLEKWIEKIERETGFTQISHTFELSGLCRACS